MIKTQLLIAFLMTLVMGNAYAQEKEPLNKHSFGTHYAVYTFYNGTPIVQTEYLFKPGSISRSLGLNYQCRLNENMSWLLSADLQAFYDYTPITEKQKGDIRSQDFLLIQGQYQYTLWESTRSLLQGAIGLSVRGGSAVVHVSFNSPDGNGGTSLVEGKSYLDLGIPFGLNYTFYMGKHFHFNTRLTHTFFPYTYEKKTQYSWDTSPYRNITSLSFGLGFNVGNKN